MGVRGIEYSGRFGAAGIALLACLALCFAFAFPASAQAADLKAGSIASGQAEKAAPLKAQAKKAPKVIKIKTATQWRNISRYNGGNFKIMKNITLPNEKYYLTISKNKKYNIDLNGKLVKTAYKGVPLRTVCPLYIKAGTVVIKTSNKQGKGVFYSTETAAVLVEGKGILYLKSGSIVNNATEFRSDITSAIMLNGSAKCYLQGKSKVQSIGNGIALFGNSRLYATGNPWVRAGANNYKGQFMHYGCGVNIASKNARILLKGGSYGTKASPDITLYSPAVSMTYAQSANYPILDQFGYATLTAKGYKYIDAKGNVVTRRGSNLSDYYNGVTAPSWTDLLASLGYREEQRMTTTTKDAAGYYSVYVRKAK